MNYEYWILSYSKAQSGSLSVLFREEDRVRVCLFVSPACMCAFMGDDGVVEVGGVHWLDGAGWIVRLWRLKLLRMYDSKDVIINGT